MFFHILYNFLTYKIIELKQGVLLFVMHGGKFYKLVKEDLPKDVDLNLTITKSPKRTCKIVPSDQQQFKRNTYKK